MAATGLTLRRHNHSAERGDVSHNASEVCTTQAASDVDGSNETLRSFSLEPHHAAYAPTPKDLSNQQHRVVHHHWGFLQSPFHWPAKNAHHSHNTPNAEIRETKTAFHFDVELPGVKDKKSISITWTSARSFLVEGSIERPEVEEGQGSAQTIDKTGYLHNVDTAHPSGKKDKSEDLGRGPEHPPWTSYTNGIVVDRARSREELPWQDIVALNERRIGSFRRSFHVPCDVENKELRATLQDGLLSIRLPKSEHEHGLDWQPKIG